MRKIAFVLNTLLAVVSVFVVVLSVGAQGEEGNGIGHYEEESTPDDPIEPDAIWNIAWSPDGSKIAYAIGPSTGQCNLSNNDYSVHILDANTYAEITTIADKNRCPALELEWSSGGTMILLASTEYARIWDVTTGQVVSGINTFVQLDPFNDHAWSPDGSKIASLSSANSRVRVWDPLTGIETNSFDIGDYAVSLTWNPEGTQLAVGTSTIEIWDVNSGTQVQSNITSGAASISWSSDGSKIAAILGTNNIRIFDAATGNLINTLAGHSATISEIAWRDDSQLLASSSLDSTVIIWDTVAGTAVGTLTHSGPVYTLDWSPNGSQITFGGFIPEGSAETVKIIQLPTANAGADQIVYSFNATASVTLDGSGSSDADGTVISYLWSQNGSEIASGVSPQVQIGIGIHTITLIVTDDNGATATDEVTIIVEP